MVSSMNMNVMKWNQAGKANMYIAMIFFNRVIWSNCMFFSATRYSSQPQSWYKIWPLSITWRSLDTYFVPVTLTNTFLRQCKCDDTIRIVFVHHCYCGWLVVPCGRKNHTITRLIKIIASHNRVTHPWPHNGPRLHGCNRISGLRYFLWMGPFPDQAKHNFTLQIYVLRNVLQLKSTFLMRNRYF